MGEGENSGIYRVPKRKARVFVKMPPVPPTWKSIFLSSSAASHQGVEDGFRSFSTRGSSFFPSGERRGAVTVVRRAAIRWVRIEEPKDIEWY